MHKIRSLFIHAIAPLSVGAAVYVLWRPTDLPFFRAFHAIGLDGVIGGLRACVRPFRNVLPGWVLVNLPDALCGYAFGAALAIVWRDGARRRSVSGIAWGVVGLVAVIAFEVLQRPGLLPGTFDPIDLVASSLGYAFGFWAARRTPPPSPPSGGRLAESEAMR